MASLSPLCTALCAQLRIDVPILQSGMNRIAGPEMVAAVSNAGGLGILASLGAPPEELRTSIRRIRTLTDRPFGVNQWLLGALSDPARSQGSAVSALQRFLNPFRTSVGLQETLAGPPPPSHPAEAAFEVLLEEKVPVWSIALGVPTGDQVRRAHEAGMQIVAMATCVEDAQTLAEAGVDAIVAQGSEGGGHRSAWTTGADPQRGLIGTMALVPQVVDAVKVPVVAAGGIADGRGLVAALSLGAQGVLLGTRFIATRESTAPTFYKDAVVTRGSDETAVTRAYSGLFARVLRNEFTEAWDKSGVAPLLPAEHRPLLMDLLVKAGSSGRADIFPLFAGQSVGLVRDLPGAADVVTRLVHEAEETLARLGSGVQRPRRGP